MLPDSLYAIPLVLILLCGYCTYRMYRLSQKVYGTNTTKMYSVFRLGGDRLVREDLEKEFFSEHRPALYQLLKLRQWSIFLGGAAAIASLALNAWSHVVR